MFHVILTPCWPKQYKVEDKRWPGIDNDSSNYFLTKGEAEKEAERRNK